MVETAWYCENALRRYLLQGLLLESHQRQTVLPLQQRQPTQAAYYSPKQNEKTTATFITPRPSTVALPIAALLPALQVAEHRGLNSARPVYRSNTRQIPLQTRPDRQSRHFYETALLLRVWQRQTPRYLTWPQRRQGYRPHKQNEPANSVAFQITALPFAMIA